MANQAKEYLECCAFIYQILRVIVKKINCAINISNHFYVYNICRDDNNIINKKKLRKRF
jgi:hypothetical protein